jgi:hypothetical protein
VRILLLGGPKFVGRGVADAALERDDEVTEESYGPLKALCEDAERLEFGERALVVRLGPSWDSEPEETLLAEWHGRP